MVATSDIFCDICAAQDLTNLANQWCPECEEALCISCIKQHSLSKLLKNHVTIDVADQNKLPDFVSNVQLSCKEHNGRFQLFCPQHDVACCAQCVSTSHSKCQDLLGIVDIVKNAKTSSSIQNVEEILNVIRKNIEIIVKNRERNLKDVQSQFQNVRDVVNEPRQRLVKHLDKLESDLLEKIKNKETKIKDDTEKVLAVMKDKDLKIQESQENIKAIKEYGTNIQTFFGTKELTKFAEAEEQSINACFEDGTLDNDNTQFELDEDIDKCLNAVAFGSLLLTTTEAGVQLLQLKDKAAQTVKLVRKMNSIDDIKVSVKNKFKVSSGKSDMSITGCDVTPGGNIVFADCNINKRVVVHSIDGTYINEVCISPKYAFDVSVIDNQNVVVSSIGNYSFQILDISHKIISKTYNYTSSYCCGITYLDGQVLSVICPKGIMSFGLQGKLSTTFRNEALGNESYVTCFQARIYYTNTYKNSVTCLNSNEEIMWTFIDESLIKRPRSITTDQHGNIFVACIDHNSIVVISADGKHGRNILDRKDGINGAWATCYDKLRDKLVVANWSGDVFVFDIVFK